jgi:type IV pilus assembly protein PilX
MKSTSQRWPYEQGASLVITLVMLLIVLILATSSSNMALMGERAVRNERDRVIALHAAESALADAELDIENSTATTSRSAIFSPLSIEGFTDGCSTGDDNIYQGLCNNVGDIKTAPWLTVDIANTNANSSSVQFGHFTGQTMPHDGGPLPGQLPRYIIELMIDNTPGQSANANYMYRITAIGFGSDISTQAVVQSFYRKSINKE